MQSRDFALLSVMCVVWGFNFVVTKWSLSGGPGGAFEGVPPLFFAAIRFTIVTVLLFPLLRPLPRQLDKIFWIAMSFGALHFILLFYGLKWATPSMAAIAIQLIAPFTVFLSVFMLKERVGLWRASGVGVSFAGVALIGFQPDNFTLTYGVIAITGAAVMAALGSILMKQLKEPPSPLRMQAWIAVMSLPFMIVATALFETGQWEAMASGGWRIWVACLYVAVGAAMFGHGAYYYLLRRYDASLVAPMTLMAPIWSITFGVLLLKDPVTWQLVIGAVLALGGVALIAVREGVRRRQARLAAAAVEGGA